MYVSARIRFSPAPPNSFRTNLQRKTRMALGLWLLAESQQLPANSDFAIEKTAPLLDVLHPQQRPVVPAGGLNRPRHHAGKGFAQFGKLRHQRLDHNRIL